MPRILGEFLEYRDTNILQDALTNATYTKACIQESYRLRPTAFCLARILEEDMELSGYSLNAGVSTQRNCARYMQIVVSNSFYFISFGTLIFRLWCCARI